MAETMPETMPETSAETTPDAKAEVVPTLIAICVVHALRPDTAPPGVTAIDKRPVEGAVQVRKLGVHADVQADRKYHGGIDQAVYVYAQEDADFWESELGRETPPGWFGENFRVSGVDVSGARPGERWTVGDGVVLEVTLPRVPCAVFARWVGGSDSRGWVKRFTTAGRPGAYARVVSTGKVRGGDRISVTQSTQPDAPTIAEMLRAAAPS